MNIKSRIEKLERQHAPQDTRPWIGGPFADMKSDTIEQWYELVRLNDELYEKLKKERDQHP